MNEVRYQEHCILQCKAGSQQPEIPSVILMVLNMALRGSCVTFWDVVSAKDLSV
jgi:hypothetical protein